MKRWSLACVLTLIASAFLVAPARAREESVDLQKLVERIVSRSGVTGLAVSVVKDGEIVLGRGYGLANTETKQPVTENTLFNIASCSKAFTAAGVALAVEEGKLRFRDKVVDHLPEFRIADPCITRKLNLADTLTHRSGLGTFYGDLLWYETDYDDDEILYRMRYLPVTNDFRSQFGYQNNMYLVAAKILQKSTGKTWSDFLYERILRPLEMEQTRTCGGDLSPEQEIALPHVDGSPGEFSFVKPHAAGSIFSSAREMSNWMRMLLDGGVWNGERILGEETVENLFRSRIALEVPKDMKAQGVHFRGYGLGWMLFDYAGVKIVQHGGGMPGYRSMVTLVPERNLGVVILANDDRPIRNAITLEVLDEFLGGGDTDWYALFDGLAKRREESERKARQDREAERAENTRPSLEARAYAGTYRDRMYGDASIALDEDVLRLTLLPAKEKLNGPLEHWHHDTFRIEFEDRFLPQGWVTFRLDSHGRVSGFTIDLPNPDLHFHNLDFERVDGPQSDGTR